VNKPRRHPPAVPPASRPTAPSPGVVRALPFDGDGAALVQAMREGRPHAATAFYDQNVDAVHGLVFRLLGPDAELEDVVHDVFVRAIESLARLRDPSALKGWLFGIAVRTVRIRIQRRMRRRWLHFMAPEDVPEVATLDPDAALGEALQDVYALVDALPVDERIALVLHRVEGLSLEEAARACETSLSTLRRRLARGEEKFFSRAKKRPALASWLEGAER
jgi:RNA polymerase sigma-70 factor (ECF subfamily)